jgi:thiamine biosynthesis lipoprotein
MSILDDQIRRYSHRAMATVFELLIAGEEEPFAAGAAAAAFDEIDRLEQDLSRYLPNSDISRINSLPPDQSVKVGADTFECLRLSLQFYTETGGAFDVTTGALKDCWMGKDRSPRLPSTGEIEAARARIGMDRLELDEAGMTVRVHGPAPLIDLGAIGKGYAVDSAAALLREWGVGSALVHGGASSAYAFGEYPGKSGWPVTLSDPADTSVLLETVHLNRRALGGSGIRQGSHIIDPRKSAPVEFRRGAWILSPSASRSDALSTACMLMTPEEIEGMVARAGDLSARIVEGDPRRALRFGIWGAG